MQTVEAIYENGTLRPIEPLTGIANNTRVRLAIEKLPPASPLTDCFGIMPNEDAEEMNRIVNDEFERVEVHGWE
jgi:predicted DNA-binding antitoxin AbrB/MazE fold protein